MELAKWQAEHVQNAYRESHYKKEVSPEDAALEIKEFPRTRTLIFGPEAFPEHLEKGRQVWMALRGGTFTIVENGKERDVRGLGLIVVDNELPKTPPVSRDEYERR